jgi:hypothetical protein
MRDGADRYKVLHERREGAGRRDDGANDDEQHNNERNDDDDDGSDDGDDDDGGERRDDDDGSDERRRLHRLRVSCHRSSLLQPLRRVPRAACRLLWCRCCLCNQESQQVCLLLFPITIYFANNILLLVRRRQPVLVV